MRFDTVSRCFKVTVWWSLTTSCFRRASKAQRRSRFYDFSYFSCENVRKSDILLCKVYEWQTWGYLMSDWVEGDDYGVVWLNPDGEQVGSDDDQLYNTPEGVELKQGYRWQGHWVVGEWEYGSWGRFLLF